MKQTTINKEKWKYGVMLNLYLAQSIPMSFFSTVLPVIMRENHFSLTSIGLIQLVKLPWLLKFLWAPVVDSAQGNISKYKKWIFVSELLYAISIFAIAFLNLETDFKTIVILLLIAFTASATQDIATDAFSYLILKKEERSIGGSIQTIGNFLGAVIGSGLLLIIYYYFGWKILISSLALFVILALIPLWKYQTKQKNHSLPVKQDKKINFKHLYRFFLQPYMKYRITLLFFIYWGIIGILTMIKPWMVDLGYSIKEIGIYSGLIGPAAGVLFAFTAGRIIKKKGGKFFLKLLLTSYIIINLYFYFISINHPSYIAIQTGIIGVWGIYSMTTVFVYSFLMNSIRNGKEGTDFTLQIVLAHLGSLIVAVLSGKIAHQLGYTGLFRISFIISFLLFLLIPYLYKKSQQYEVSN
jgi:predicted MFS family arabinose efflux permease